MENLAPIACGQALALLYKEELNLHRFAVALGTMYGYESDQWPEAISNISRFSVSKGSHSFDELVEAAGVYDTTLPHRGSLQLVRSYRHIHAPPDGEEGEKPYNFVMGQLTFPVDRLQGEHFGVVPGNYMAESLAQLLAVAAITNGQLKEGYVPLLAESLGRTKKPLPTSSEDPIWGIIAYAPDKDVKRFAAVGLIGQDTNLIYAGAVLGVSYPRCRLK